jgi:hypothetical protein
MVTEQKARDAKLVTNLILLEAYPLSLELASHSALSLRDRTQLAMRKVRFDSGRFTLIEKPSASFKFLTAIAAVTLSGTLEESLIMERSMHYVRGLLALVNEPSDANLTSFETLSDKDILPLLSIWAASKNATAGPSEDARDALR